MSYNKYPQKSKLSSPGIPNGCLSTRLENYFEINKHEERISERRPSLTLPHPSMSSSDLKSSFPATDQAGYVGFANLPNQVVTKWFDFFDQNSEFYHCLKTLIFSKLGSSQIGEKRI